MAALVSRNAHQRDGNKLLTCPFGCTGGGRDRAEKIKEKKEEKNKFG